MYSLCSKVSFFIGVLRGPGVRCVVDERSCSTLEVLQTNSPFDDAFEQPVADETSESDAHSEPAAISANPVENYCVSRRKIGEENSEKKMSEEMFECFECHGKFSALRSLRKHRTRAHSGKKINCEFCDKQFHHKDNLKQHMKKHLLRGTKKKRKAKKKNIICKHCKVKFTKNSSLKRHISKHNS